jgi:hypothetical protein
LPQHLLKQAGLVADQAAETKRLYRTGRRVLRGYLDQMWSDALTAFAAAAEASTREGEDD